MQHGQQKRGGLAAACLAGNQQVGEFGFFALGLRFQALHGLRYRGQLHGGGLGKTQVSHRLQEFGGQPQFHKTVGHGRDGCK